MKKVYKKKCSMLFEQTKNTKKKILNYEQSLSSSSCTYSAEFLMLYNSIIDMHIYTYTCRIHIDTMNKDTSLKKYTSHFI